MLSYRHGYHAGNHADVLKHAVLCLLLNKLTSKQSPCTYIDTHAGAGRYDLSQPWAQRTNEHALGVDRLLDSESKSDLLKGYLDCVRDGYRQGKGYPGSPAIAQALLRPGDKIILMELHNNEFEILKRNCRDGKRTSFHHRNGFEGLVAMSPPPHPRGLALVDPSYEVISDYELAASSVAKAAARWATGTFAVWYPVLGKNRDQSDRLLHLLRKQTTTSLLRAELDVKGAGEDYGMHGSGMAIVNPPWQLDEQLRSLLPELTESLAQDSEASFRLEWLRERT